MIGAICNRDFYDLELTETAIVGVGVSERGVGLQLTVLPPLIGDFESIVVYMTRHETAKVIELLGGTLAGREGGTVQSIGNEITERRVWIAGNSGPDRWELIGVFETEEAAVRACTAPTHFIAPMVMGHVGPSTATTFPGSRFPWGVSELADRSGPAETFCSPVGTFRRNEAIEALFTYHEATGDQPGRYQRIREAACLLAYVIDDCCEPGPDRTAAVRKISEAVMTANKSIATRNAQYR